MKLTFILSLFIASSAFAQTPDWRPINRVYKLDGQTVGNVGSAGQIKAGHVLTTKSFPLAALDTAKLSFWTLESVNDGYGSRNLALQGTGAFASENVLGQANKALTLDGGTGFANLTGSSFADIGGGDWSIGGWFKASNWAAASKVIFSAHQADILKYLLQVRTQATGIELSLGYATGAWSYQGVTAMTFAANSWHHIAVVGNSSAASLFVDGIHVGGPFSYTYPGTLTSPVLIVGAGSSFGIAGAASNFFAIKGAALSAQDIRRLYSTRIDHNKNLIAKRQDWHFKHQHLGTAGNPYQTLPFVWHDPTDANSLFADFSDLDATDKIDIRLYDLQQ